MHLVRRLNKGPYKMYSARMWEGEYSQYLYLQPLTWKRPVTFETRVEGDLLYKARTNDLALVIEHNFDKQVENTSRIMDAMKRRLFADSQ